MNELEKCPTCGAELAAEATDGLCLNCLGQLGFSSETSDPKQSGLMRLGDYELLEEIARGGMGVVYRARQLSLNRIVALKVVLHGPFSSPDFVNRFRKEAQIVAALQHPNIVSIYEVGQHDGSHFIALEYVEGGNFAELVRERPLSPKLAAEYVRLIAEAVEHAHQRGVLHRDLKPSNILLDCFGQPRVTDFGLGKLAGTDVLLTVTGQVLGSPNYMSPEQAAGKFSDCTAQSDIYSLGAILYELLTGRPPFQGESLPLILAQVQNTEPVPLRRLDPGIPVNLQTICLKCLQKEPARRYASAQALADDLKLFLAGKPVLARPIAATERLWFWCKRQPGLAAISAGFFIAISVGLIGIIVEWRKAEFNAKGELHQRLLAEQETARERMNLYAADVAFASQAVQNGNIGLARSTLEALRPKVGEKDLRGFEWRYVRNLCHGDELARLAGHDETVTCVAFSKDGKWLAAGGQDGTVIIWKIPTREKIVTLKVTRNSVWNLAFTADDQWLMTACNEKVELWETKSWERKKKFAGELAVLSKSGDLMATAESSPFFSETLGPVKLWNWRTGELLRRLESTGRALALSSDGHLLAMAGTNSHITVWDTDTGALVRAWTAPFPIWTQNFSPDGKTLLAAGWSSDVLIYSMEGQPALKILSGHPLHVWSAVFSEDGSTIATTSSDQTVRLWDALSLQPKAVLHGHNSEVWAGAFDSEGELLATGGKDHSVLLFSALAAPAQSQFPNNEKTRPLFSPDGHWLVTTDGVSQHCSLWNTAGGTLVASNLAGGNRVYGFLRNGKRLVTFDVDRYELNMWLPEGTAPEGEVKLTGLKPNAPRAGYFVMSPGQDFCLAVDVSGQIYIWETENGKLLRTLPGPRPPIRNALFSPDTKQIALCVERENFARVYDLTTGAEKRLSGHLDFVSGLAFSPDSETVATGSMDGTIRLWGARTGKTIATLPGHMQESTDVAFSPDGLTLASLGHRESLKLWHLPTMREVVFQSYPQAGMWLSFSPDGGKLAVETGTNTVSLLAAPKE